MATSWVPGADGSGFGLAHLPYGVVEVHDDPVPHSPAGFRCHDLFGVGDGMSGRVHRGIATFQKGDHLGRHLRICKRAGADTAPLPEAVAIGRIQIDHLALAAQRAEPGLPPCGECAELHDRGFSLVGQRPAASIITRHGPFHAPRLRDLLD